VDSGETYNINFDWSGVYTVDKDLNLYYSQNSGYGGTAAGYLSPTSITAQGVPMYNVASVNASTGVQFKDIDIFLIELEIHIHME